MDAKPIELIPCFFITWKLCIIVLCSTWVLDLYVGWKGHGGDAGGVEVGNREPFFAELPEADH